jgi:DnaJ-domain-containing protein 1
MSIPDRIWRIARQRVRSKLGMQQGSAFRESQPWSGGSASSPREELEEYLRTPEAERLRTTGASGGPASATHPYAREYKLLGAPIGSDLETVQRCWRKLVRETHPDRFAGDADEQKRAADRLRRVNNAYERLKKYLETSA